jgi:hypothetical protein
MADPTVMTAERIAGQTVESLRPVHCQNKRCNNGRPIGRMVPGSGTAEFSCKACGVRRVVFGADIRRKEGA